MTVDEIVDEVLRSKGVTPEQVKEITREADACFPETVKVRDDDLHPEAEAMLRALLKAMDSLPEGVLARTAQGWLDAKRSQAIRN